MLRSSLSACCFLMATLASSAVRAGGADYVFVANDTGLRAGTAAAFEVRLVDKAGLPVADAKIIRMRLDMAPDGMAQHTSAIMLEPAGSPGHFRARTEFQMPGRWQLSLAARISSEPETIQTKLILKVAP